jgi:hypothetical protein
LSGWIGVDLDGTLAHYEGERSIFEIGPPIKEMQERVIGWIQHGRDVRIFTARIGPHAENDADQSFILQQRVLIEKWCDTHLGTVLPITATKDFRMEVLYDDRCVQVETNTGRLVRHGIRLVTPDPDPANELRAIAA